MYMLNSLELFSKKNGSVRPATLCGTVLIVEPNLFPEAVMKVTYEEQILQLATVVLTDAGCEKPVPAYLFSETVDALSHFQKGVELLRNGRASKLYIFDDVSRSNTGYAGVDFSEQKLRGFGAKPKEIERIPYTGKESFHTLIEALVVIDFARKNGWRNLIIVAPPFHQLRCFITMVSALLRLRASSRLAVWNHVADPEPWGVKVRHSQGTLRAKRVNLVPHESRRLPLYQANGSMVPFKSVFAYLKKRKNWK